jgi:GDP-mannose pyrophosphatase NudK
LIIKYLGLYEMEFVQPISFYILKIKAILRGMSKRVKNIDIKVLSDNWYILKKVSFDYLKNNGTWESHQREAYDRGNGAAILLYNSAQKTVILVRQFRMPTYLNGNTEGFLIEAPAGLLDESNPEECIIREVYEETGYTVSKVKKVFEAYMSPGSVTEILHFFIGEYTPFDKTHIGGGLAHEEEDIEVLELPFHTALDMVADGRIKDGKTIMLLQYAKVHNLI